MFTTSYGYINCGEPPGVPVESALSGYSPSLINCALVIPQNADLLSDEGIVPHHNQTAGYPISTYPYAGELRNAD
jgi:hypothetical protein